MNKLSPLLVAIAMIQPAKGLSDSPADIDKFYELTSGMQSLSSCMTETEKCRDVRWTENSILYIDTALITYEDIKSEAMVLIARALNQNAMVLLDNSKLMSASIQRLEDIMLKVLGIGIVSPYMVVFKDGGQYQVEPANTLEDMADLLENTKEERVEKMKYPSVPVEFSSYGSARTGSLYIPEKSVNVRVRRSGISCHLSSSTDFTGTKDYCNASASIDMLVNVSMVRSIIAPKPDGSGNTRDAKYVRFTVSRDNGTGAGIHLADDLVQEHAWFQTYQNRHDRFGPYAQSYDISISSMGSKPYSHITYHTPLNQNKEYKETKSSTFSIGVDGSLSAGVGADGPKIGGEAGGSMGYSLSRSLSWNTMEYRISNMTRENTFRVLWERDLDFCQEMITGHCDDVESPFFKDYTIDERKFSPIAYRNFVPNFDVVFEAPSDTTGKEKFRILSNIEIKARYGRVTPFGLYVGVTNGGAQWINQSEGYNVTVDWGHPVFEPEPNVRLRSLEADNVCLRASGSTVYGAHCSVSLLLDGIWGLDDKERYKNRKGHNECLGVKQNGSVYIGECNDNLSQKWYWEDNQLVSRYRTDSGDRWLLALNGTDVMAIPESNLEDGYQTAWRPELAELP